MKTKNYSPLYFLAALGPGWMAVGFFMYLMFMTKHKGIPIPTFETIIASFSDWNLFLKAMIIMALTGIVYFSYQHIKYLICKCSSY